MVELCKQNGVVCPALERLADEGPAPKDFTQQDCDDLRAPRTVSGRNNQHLHIVYALRKETPRDKCPLLEIYELQTAKEPVDYASA